MGSPPTKKVALPRQHHRMEPADGSLLRPDRRKASGERSLWRRCFGPAEHSKGEEGVSIPGERVACSIEQQLHRVVFDDKRWRDA